MEGRVDWMLKNLEKELEKGDNIVDVFGFSRGAATGTLFLNKIKERMDSSDPKYAKYKI